MQLLTGNDGHYHIAWGVFIHDGANHVAPVGSNGTTDHWLSVGCFCEPKLDPNWSAWPIYIHHEVSDDSD